MRHHSTARSPICIRARATGQRFDAVRCVGVLLYLDDPRTPVRALCRAVRPGGLVSIMTLAPHGPATRAVLDRRWADAPSGVLAACGRRCGATADHNAAPDPDRTCC